MFDLEEELKRLLANPGVYLMYNDRDEITYVGKAISLKNRARQYFQNSRNKTAKTEQTVSCIAWFEYILTDSGLEVLVLECNLVKEHRPRYNTMLKDDKSYPYIKATTGGDFPRLLFARDMKRDGRGRYLGPYTSAGAMEDTLDLIHKLCRIRICNRNPPKDMRKERSCLNYHIRQRNALCQGYISREEYQSNFNQALGFLNGRFDPPIRNPQEKMQTASDNLESERAIEYRELLDSVKQVTQKQKIISNDMEDRDIVAMTRDGRDAVVQMLFIREGKLIGRDHFHISAAMTGNEGEILNSFVKQFYVDTPSIPRELWLQHPLGDEEVISQWLSAKRGQKARLVVSRKGEKGRLVELAARNAALVLSQGKKRIKKEEPRAVGAINQIGELIGIGDIRCVRAYDISNTSGVGPVGSMVVYEDGGPRHSDYKKLRIRTAQGPNGYVSMEEVLTRGFSHGIRGTEELKERGVDLSMGSFTRFPDLIMMNGGRGQTDIVLRVLDKLGFSIPVYGITGDDNHRTKGFYCNNVETLIDRHSKGFRLITRIQDEAHHFAIEYHGSLEGKGQVKSTLDGIPGVGPARRKALTRRFRDIETVRSASVEELGQTP